MAKRRGNGEGSIYERKKGQWAGAISDGVDPKTGKTRRKFVYGKTREEVRDKLRELQNQQAAHGIIDAGKLNLTTWLQTWCENYAKANIKETTYESYLQQINCHIIPELGGILLKRLTTTDIQRFYTKLLECGNKSKVKDPETGEMVDRGGGLAASSVIRIHNILNAALEQAKQENKITVNPVAAAKPPKNEQEEMKVLSQNQVSIFLQSTKKYRYYGAYLLGAGSGMRRGEVLGLAWCNFDLNYCTQDSVTWDILDDLIPWDKFEDIQPWDTDAVADILTQVNIDYSLPVVYICQQLNLVKGGAKITSPKSKKSVRPIHIPTMVACALVYQRYLQRKEKLQAGDDYNSQDLIFCTSTGKPVPPRGFTRNFQGALRHAGLERIRFHDLRHTVATVLLEEGAALNTVQELLGHYDPTFTARQYGHVTTRMRSDATNKLNGMLSAAYEKDYNQTRRP